MLGAAARACQSHPHSPRSWSTQAPCVPLYSNGSGSLGFAGCAGRISIRKTPVTEEWLPFPEASNKCIQLVQGATQDRAAKARPWQSRRKPRASCSASRSLYGRHKAFAKRTQFGLLGFRRAALGILDCLYKSTNSVCTLSRAWNCCAALRLSFLGNCLCGAQPRGFRQTLAVVP